MMASPEPTRRDDELVLEVLRLRAERLSICEIAEEVGLEPPVVFALLWGQLMFDKGE